MRPDRLLARVLRGESGNVALADLIRLIEALGFAEVGGRGSHRVFLRPGVTELLNLQDDGGGQAEALPGEAGRESHPQVRSDTGGLMTVPAYRIEVSWSVEDEIWIADVPDLAFCTAHGPTPHEAVEAVEQAVVGWLDAARAAGRAVPTPSRGVLRA